MNGYVCFYKNKRLELYAETSAKAQEQAAAVFKAKRAWEITVVLAEKNGEQVTHSTASI